MVLGVCRRVLRDHHDAEDAFQATFLLLARKARSLRQPEQLGPWLYGVAYRTAVKARANAVRRRARERPVADLPSLSTTDDPVWCDLRPVLDDAIQWLPQKYRVPFVLCYLEGMTNAEAACHLGCPQGTIATRLARARERLRIRLTRQGVTLSASSFALLLAREASAETLALTLCQTTVRAATAFATSKVVAAGFISANVVALTEGVWKGMLMTKLRMVCGALAAVMVAGAGAGVLTYGASDQQPVPRRETVPVPATGVQQEPAEKPATYRTTNFVVEAPMRRIAQIIGDAAEHQRKVQAISWLGKELPAWSERCPVRVKLTLGRGAGATTFMFDKGVVKSQSMTLEGSLEQILASTLPHEMTHTVLAHFFGEPIPRWADEGAAVLSEDVEEQQWYEKLVRQILKDGREIALRRLLDMKQFPTDAATLFAQGYSLTRFLVEQKDRPTFLKFVKYGSTVKDADAWDKALRLYYDVANVEILERSWLTSLGISPPFVATDLRTFSVAPPTEAPAPLPSIQVARAFVDDKGQIVLRWPVEIHQAVTTYVQRPGENSYTPVTSYRNVSSTSEQRFPPTEVKVFRLKGTTSVELVEQKNLGEILREGTIVVVHQPGEAKEAFDLRLQTIKEGTIVLSLVPPVLPRPPMTVAPDEPAPAVREKR
jgi:RNA polymerase sigma factor (sigma-70 family)